MRAVSSISIGISRVQKPLTAEIAEALRQEYEPLRPRRLTKGNHPFSAVSESSALKVFLAEIAENRPRILG